MVSSGVVGFLQVSSVPFGFSSASGWVMSALEWFGEVVSVFWVSWCGFVVVLSGFERSGWVLGRFG